MFICLALALMLSCNSKQLASIQPHKPYKSKKLIVVLIDGPRWEETWGDSTHQYQPYMASYLRNEGCIFTNFNNLGYTITNPGHCAVLTGNYESLANNGAQLPSYPSLAQTFLQKTQHDSTSAWLITSKDKLEIFKTCLQSSWSNQYMPSVDCGVGGLGTGYRHDSITFLNAMNVLQNSHPDFMFISFRDPDFSAHANDWNGYLEGIKRGDKYVYELFNFLQTDTVYKNQTTFVVTNDHGRHPDNLGGFTSHGDNCSGCKHINLFIAGPDIKKNQIITTFAEQIDLHFTLSHIHGLTNLYSKGKLIPGIFN